MVPVIGYSSLPPGTEAPEAAPEFPYKTEYKGIYKVKQNILPGN